VWGNASSWNYRWRPNANWLSTVHLQVPGCVRPSRPRPIPQCEIAKTDM